MSITDIPGIMSPIPLTEHECNFYHVYPKVEGQKICMICGEPLKEEKDASVST